MDDTKGKLKEFFSKCLDIKVFEKKGVRVKSPIIDNRKITISNYGSSDLIVFRGIPGTGKTTIAGVLKDIFNGVEGGKQTVTIAADEFPGLYHGKKLRKYNIGHAHVWCQEQTMKSLYEGKRVIVHNTNINLWELRQYAYLQSKGIIVVQVDFIDNNIDNYISNTHGVDPEVCKEKEKLLKLNPSPSPHRFGDFYQIPPNYTKPISNEITALIIPSDQILEFSHYNKQEGHAFSRCHFHATSDEFSRLDFHAIQKLGGYGKKYRLKGTEIREIRKGGGILRGMKVFVLNEDCSFKRELYVNLIATFGLFSSDTEKMFSSKKKHLTKIKKCDVRLDGYLNSIL